MGRVTQEEAKRCATELAEAASGSMIVGNHWSAISRFIEQHPDEPAADVAKALEALKWIAAVAWANNGVRDRDETHANISSNERLIENALRAKQPPANGVRVEIVMEPSDSRPYIKGEWEGGFARVLGITEPGTYIIPQAVKVEEPESVDEPQPDPGPEPRKEVMSFARSMERRLRLHDNRPGWKQEKVSYLYDRLLQELTELESAIEEDHCTNICKETADVANFAMMIHDVRITQSMQESKPEDEDVAWLLQMAGDSHIQACSDRFRRIAKRLEEVQG